MDLKKEAAAKAITLIRDKTIVGLGAGSTIAYVVEFLKQEIENGLQIKFVTSSFSTRQLLLKNEVGNPDIKHPVVLLDGVPQFDNGNKITHYNALKVKELEIILDKYYLGPATFNGIASFTTYKGDLEGFQIDTAATLLDYEALQLKREFYSPVYQTKDELESRLPDFRNLLYWTPDIKTGENGEQQVSFYTSDQPGKYAVVLQGLSASGNAGSKVFIIEVKKGK